MRFANWFLNKVNKIKEKCVIHVCLNSKYEETIKGNHASFSLKDAPAPHLVVNLDMLRQVSPPGNANNSDSCADYLFVTDGPVGTSGYVAVIEMTSGKTKL